jgi:hypothetical protein
VFCFDSWDIPLEEFFFVEESGLSFVLVKRFVEFLYPDGIGIATEGIEDPSCNGNVFDCIEVVSVEEAELETDRLTSLGKRGFWR